MLPREEGARTLSVCNIERFQFPSAHALTIGGMRTNERPEVLTRYDPPSGVSAPAHGWRVEGEWSEAEGVYRLAMSDRGVWALHLRLRDAETGEPTANVWMGQVRVIDPALYATVTSLAYEESFAYDSVAITGYRALAREVRDAAPPTIEELGALLRAAFADFHDQLAAEFPSISDGDLRALHLLHAVAVLWPYGPCTLDAAEPPATFAAFLGHPTACCTDYTLTLYELLRLEGRAARVAVVPGHNFIEADLAAGPRLLDPTAILFIEGSIAQIAAGKRLEVNVFAHDDNVARAQFRPSILTQLALQGESAFAAEDDPAATWMGALLTLIRGE